MFKLEWRTSTNNRAVIPRYLKIGIDTVSVLRFSTIIALQEAKRPFIVNSPGALGFNLKQM